MSLLQSNFTEKMELLHRIVPPLSNLLNRDLDAVTFHLQCDIFCHRLYYLAEILHILKTGTKETFNVGNIEIKGVIKELIEIKYIPEMITLDKFMRNFARDVRAAYDLYAWLLDNSHVLKFRTLLKNFLLTSTIRLDGTFDGNKLAEDFWTVYERFARPRMNRTYLPDVQGGVAEMPLDPLQKSGDPKVSGNESVVEKKYCGTIKQNVLPNMDTSESSIPTSSQSNAIIRKEEIAYVKLLLLETLQCAVEHDEYIREVELLKVEMEKKYKEENISDNRQDIDVHTLEEKLLRELNDIRNVGMDSIYLPTTSKTPPTELFHGKPWVRFISEIKKKCRMHKEKRENVLYRIAQFTLLNRSCDVIHSIISAAKHLVKLSDTAVPQENESDHLAVNSTEEATNFQSSVSIAEFRKEISAAMERVKSTASMDKLKEQKVLNPVKMAILEWDWRVITTDLSLFHTIFTILLDIFFSDDKDLLNKQSREEKCKEAKRAFVNIGNHITFMLTAVEHARNKLLDFLKVFAMTN